MLTKEDNGLPVDAIGNLSPYKFSWPKMSQRLRIVELIQLFPGHYGPVTMMVATAGDSYLEKWYPYKSLKTGISINFFNPFSN